MRIDPPTEAEKAVLERALLAAASELGIDPDRPLSLAMFVTRAELVAHNLVNELVRSDRHRHRLTYQEIGTAFGITMQSAHHRFRDRNPSHSRSPLNLLHESYRVAGGASATG